MTAPKPVPKTRPGVRGAHETADTFNSWNFATSQQSGLQQHLEISGNTPFQSIISVYEERCRLSPQQVSTLVISDSVKVAIKSDQQALELLGSRVRTHTARRTLADALSLESVEELPGAENAVADQDVRSTSGGAGMADSASAPVQGLSC